MLLVQVISLATSGAWFGCAALDPTQNLAHGAAVTFAVQRSALADPEDLVFGVFTDSTRLHVLRASRPWRKVHGCRFAEQICCSAWKATTYITRTEPRSMKVGVAQHAELACSCCASPVTRSTRHAIANGLLLQGHRTVVASNMTELPPDLAAEAQQHIESWM